MEPRIQYAKTSDGVNIAYAALGSGPAIVFPSNLFGGIHAYRNNAGPNLVIDGLLTHGWSVITYDGRGMGSSDRNCEDYTIEGRVRDLDAIVERAAPDRFALYGWLQGGPPALAYAVRHPDRATHLILANTYARGFDWYELIPAMRMSRDPLSLDAEEWEFYLLGLANAITGYADSERARDLAEVYKAGVNLKDYVAFVEATKQIDLRGLLPEVRVPTLVVRDTSGYSVFASEVRIRIAPLIPNARFVETSDVAMVIDEFLREGKGATATELPSGTAIILFADIVDSTGLTERLGDTAFREKARGLDEAMRAAIRESGGTAVEGKTLGDGVLAVFTSAKQAIACAQACHEAAGAAGLSLHAGIHAGDVIREADNVYGGAVNIAARIAAASAAGETLVSETVRSLARTSAGVAFEDRGKQALKGIGETVRVWAVREGEA